MSNGNRRIGIAALGAVTVFVALGTGAYFGALYSPNNQQHQAIGSDTSASEASQDRGQSLSDVAGLPEPVERAIKNPSAENRQDREQRDLSAQEGMAVWAFWVAFFAGVTALITGAGTILIWRQVRLTQEAVKGTGDATIAMQDSNRIALDAHRPWIAVSLYLDAAKVTEGVLQITYIIEYKNIGKTVAQFFTARHKIHMTGGAFGKLVAQSQLEAREKDKMVSRVLMPDEVYHHTGRKSYTLDELAWAGKRKRRFLAVSASAFYNLPGEKWGALRRHTERAFLIVTEDTFGRPQKALFKSRVPQSGPADLHVIDTAPRSAN